MTPRDRLVRLIARVPVGVHAKLVAAFLTIAVLLITVGALALTLLSEAHGRAEELVRLQRKIAAYRQLQNDTTAQLYSVASALLVPDEPTLAATLRQLSQFGYDFDHLQFVASDEVEVLRQIQETHDLDLSKVEVARMELQPEELDVALTAFAMRHDRERFPARSASTTTSRSRSRSGRSSTGCGGSAGTRRRRVR